MFASPILKDSLTMFACRVSFVFIPMIHRILLVKGFHIRIAVGFGQHRSSSNTHKASVSLHLAGVGNLLVGLKTIAVHYDKLGGEGQLIQSLMHSLNRSVEDINLVNSLRGQMHYSIAQRLLLNDRA